MSWDSKVKTQRQVDDWDSLPARYTVKASNARAIQPAQATHAAQPLAQARALPTARALDRHLGGWSDSGSYSSSSSTSSSSDQDEDWHTVVHGQAKFHKSPKKAKKIEQKIPKHPLYKLKTVPIISAGDLQLPFGCYDTVDEGKQRGGFAYSVAKLAFRAVGLIEGKHLHFASLRSDAIVETSSQQPGSAFQTGYADASTSFIPTKLRKANFLLGLPVNAGFIQAALWRLPNSTVPLPARPTIGIISDYALEEKDLRLSGVRDFNVLYFASNEAGTLVETVLSKFGTIDLLFYFTNLYDQHGQPLLEISGKAFSTRKFAPGLLFNKRSPDAKKLQKAYHKGLETIVRDGVYQTLWDQFSCEGQPWRTSTFPQLSHPKTKIDIKLAALIKE